MRQDTGTRSVRSTGLVWYSTLKVSTGLRTNMEAVYQLLERPILGRFIFVNQAIEIPQGEGEASGMAVMPTRSQPSR